MKLLTPLLVALLAGVSATLGLAPFNITVLALLSPALLYFILTVNPKPNTQTLIRGPRRHLLVGWCFGLGLYGSGASWVYVSMTEHSDTSVWLGILMTSLFVMVLALFFAVQLAVFEQLTKNRARWFRAALFIAIWVVFEWLRSVVLTGFPWLYLGYSLLDTPWQTLAPIGGVWLASAWVVSLAVIGCHLTKRMARHIQSRHRAIKLNGLTTSALGLLCIGLLIGPVLLPSQWTQVVYENGQPKTANITLIQANIDQAIKWQPEARHPILRQYAWMTQQAIESSTNTSNNQNAAEIVIWSETAIPALFSQALGPLSPLLGALDNQKISLISGIPTRVRQANGSHHDFNSVAVLSSGFGLYHKQRLVPFGEYLPLRSVLHGLISFFELPMSSFRLPQAPQTLLVAQGHQIAASICYEIAYPRLIQELGQTSDWLLTVSNDTWFGRSIAPAQHHQISRMRALENGRSLVRATNNGISSIIGHDGKETLRLPQYQTTSGQGQVTAMTGLTPFQRTQGLMAVIPSALLLVIAFLLRMLRRKT